MKIQGENERNSHLYYEFDRSADRVGEGGMGVVFRGRMIDEQTGAFREVAIKEVHSSGDSPEDHQVYERARREAIIQFRNDNLVEMLGCVEVEDRRLGMVRHRLYIISEFLTGVTLDKVLEGKCLDYEGNEIPFAADLWHRYRQNREETATFIIKQILSGIVPLHDNGYLHRDIDPSNIMVTADGKIKLIDFGIAQKVEQLDSVDSQQKDGAFVGKVEYAAPELIEGKVSAQDFSTDIYSVGVLFYRLLTGVLPFGGNRYDIMKAQLSRKPDLSKIHSRKYRAIVAKALSKQQQDRYVSASSMRAAIDEKAPAPRWIPLAAGVAGVVLVGVLLAVFLKGGKGDDDLRKVSFVLSDGREVTQVWNGDKMLDSDTTFTTRNNQEQVEEQVPVRDVSAVLEKPIAELWAQLRAEPKHPAALLAASRYYESHPLDDDARSYWRDTALAEGLAGRYLREFNQPTSRRLAYLLACEAREQMGTQPVNWHPADFPRQVQAQVDKLAASSDNFINPFN